MKRDLHEVALRRGHLLAIVLGGFLVRLWFIWRYPAVFGGDAVLRLANPEHVLLSHQLPLPQLIVHVLHPLMPGPMLIRCAMAIAGALAGACFYLFAGMVVPANVAFLGTAFFVLNPLVLTASTVPYQEIFFLLGLLGALYGALTSRWYLAAVCLAVGCLARYECWLACPIVGMLYMRDKGWSLRRAFEALVLFGCVPLAWIAYHSGLTGPGSAAIEPTLNPERLWRWVHLGGTTVRATITPALPLAAWGAWLVLRQGLWRQAAWSALGAFVALFLIAILFSAHGVSPNPERYVTGREAHILLVVVALLATIGLQGLPRYRTGLAALSAVFGLVMSDRAFRVATSDPPFALSFSAARYLDANMTMGEHAVVLSAPITQIENYLDGLERRRGPAGRAAAIAVLNGMDARPPNFQRILVNSHFDKNHLINYSNLIAHTPAGADTVVMRPVPPRSPEWIVMWSDFRPTSADESRLAALTATVQPMAMFRKDSLSLAVYDLTGRR